MICFLTNKHDNQTDMTIQLKAITLALLGGVFLSNPCPQVFAADQVIVGSVRVQLLSGSLVRLELKGAEGFEQRNTFHIVNRDWAGTAYTTNTRSGEVIISTSNYQVRVPQNAVSLDGVQVESAAGERLYQYDGVLTNSVWLPGPAEKVRVWCFADTPRIIPPEWGLTAAPARAKASETSGWDLNNNAPDVYVFVPGGDYRQLRGDFLKLTGPTEMPPLFVFGAFDSRYYSYTEATALKQIDDYRAHQISLDVLVIDTGWRKGASTGYQPDINLFPNMSRFLKEAHAKHIHLMFNDHPEPVAKTGLAPKELNYRCAGLAGLLNEGLDFWWYDRNWNVALVTPAPNLRKEVWGMRLYHDTTQRVRPGSRPLIMANVDGIDNGIRNRPMDVASHRFPIQWTGDIGPGYDFLRRAVENALYSGVQSLFPYESDDLGGHVADPSPEGYIRWIEYGALSPVYRPHCTLNHERMPWTFGPQAEEIARNLLNMRYRLLPVFYAAAHENYETGEPLLRRLDLDYSQFAGASRADEYMLGKYILVAPVLEGSSQIVPADWLKTPDGQPGLHGDFYNNETLRGSPVLTRTDSNVDFNWGENSPGPNVSNKHFSARWIGTIQVPQNVGDVLLASLADDGARVWIDGKRAIDAWGAHDSTTTEASVGLTAGKPHQLRIEYQQIAGKAVMRLRWRLQGNVNNTLHIPRAVWIPPGNWINAWTGETISGPTTVTNEVPLNQIPLFIKSGAVLPLAPEMQFTGEKPWDPITLDLYPCAGETNTTGLYEDDTLTTAYQRGEFRNTTITASADDTVKTVSVEIGAAAGSFQGALNERAWILRIHSPANWSKEVAPLEVKVNGQKMNAAIRRLARAETAMPFGDKVGAPDADVFEIRLPAAPASEGQSVEISFATPPNR